MNSRPILNLTQTAATLTRNAYGKLALTGADGQIRVGVVPVRAFPIQAPERDISLLDADGHEVAWIDELARVPEPAQGLIRAALAEREFMPEIRAILGVSSFSTPSTWQVRTDRGDTSFVLKGDEDIRRLAGNTLLVTDTHGIQFLIRDMTALDRESRRLLDRFK
ncbi:DUF1854 domain-containing protein [Rhodoferax sp. BAB1]|uniref:cyanophycin metabolism-associated DUF1854 family protein n=1 Tax=Rhodoferax sp. BAB1 TaxID=2741720 RepID=UPI0015770CC6|nr:DUF1854 domain-containing protein [Rhodoferax sp. BAB1]QKO20726.1 DUF1854 domain-containing protein [Rhodoferax sp. BAB1]